VSRFIEGEPRAQSVLFPESLDEWIAQDNPVRVVDAFVEELDLERMGFERAVPAETGRPGYHPATLLKIYIYGYLNRIQSSRRLEREAQRNLELVWLTCRLMPDFKTIADFRRDNGKAIGQVCARFVALCREMKLFTEAMVAVDGSKFKAANHRDRNYTERKVESRIAHLEKSVKQYLKDLDRADRLPSTLPEARVEQLQQKIATVRAEISKLHDIQKELPTVPDAQISVTDPDARSMNSAGKGTGIVGYNVQTAVDTKNHLIVAHEVTNVGHDRTHLTPMAKSARDAMGKKHLRVLADRGYFKGEQILACKQAGMTPLVPKALTSGGKAGGRFDKRDFHYDARRDLYRCPAGEKAIWRYSAIEHGMKISRYWASACPRCPLKARCTPSPYRRISRWEHEAVLDAMQRRLERTPEASRWRRQTVEHPFGTIKSWMGSTHFLMKTLPRVRTEMSLQVLAYNLKRVMTLIGVQPLIAAIAR
jgi:transposase